MSDRPDFCTKRGCKAYSESGCPSCERDAATQALTDTRERLEQAESLLEDARDTICVVQTDHAKYSIGEIDKYFSAIAAKACTGGKGEEQS